MRKSGRIRATAPRIRCTLALRAAKTRRTAGSRAALDASLGGQAIPLHQDPSHSGTAKPLQPAIRGRVVGNAG